MAIRFELLAVDAATGARRGRLHTPHGVVDTPAFMPVGTQATVKALTWSDVAATGAQMVLANTYHLVLRPGPETVQRLGGLHGMTGWTGGFLTDSGGYQVFSLRDRLRIDDRGVTFRSHLDGSIHELTPERAVAVQEQLGADIIMCLDDVQGHDAPPERMVEAMTRSLRWVERCAAAQTTEQALFGIQQGGFDRALRQASSDGLAALDLPGYAIGGLSVGEPTEVLHEQIAYAPGLLPADKPRYLMGVGWPEDLVAAVAAGCDLFDCVLPTRLGRNAAALTEAGRINLRNARFADDRTVLDPDGDGEAALGYRRGYLRHLVVAKEILAARVLTLNNVRFYQRLMERMRAAIEAGTFAAWQAEFLTRGVR